MNYESVLPLHFYCGGSIIILKGVIIIRLWHESLIPLLPRQQLLGQHRELCALRGNGWGRPHSVVNYVFKYDRIKLYQYHYLVMREMFRRGYHVAPEWWNAAYRGKQCEPDTVTDIDLSHVTVIYPEHDEDYLQLCLQNLQQKGIDLKISA